MPSPSLLLLVFCATSLLPPCGGFGTRRLCGIQLVEALLFVCGEKGVFYQPGRRIRQENLRVMMKDGVLFPLEISEVLQKSGSRMKKRGIVEQCCHFYCDYYDLENYCNT
ncbi:insulin [Astyanax mexicanus]|uniref:Insulin n=1 Tax=Astyanax mexicanus TaxID=7994 RepID=A0A8T2L585_ASTMX|nr:insulin [Astyanax mexicanus]KAG9264141.1 insulin-like [Astyanax mexicanus]